MASTARQDGTERKRPYCIRERLLELGPVGESDVTELVDQRPHTWKGDVERLAAATERVAS